MLGLISGLARAADGKDKIPMLAFVAFVGAVIGLITLKETEVPYYYHLAFCALGVLIWKAGAWGNYFASFNSYWNRLRSDVKWIDWIGYKLVPYVDKVHPTNRKRGLICMAIRGAIYSAPLFFYLGYAVHPLGYLLWPLMAMQGVFYWVAYWVKDDFEGGLQVSFAEILTIWFMVDLAMHLLIV
jgi:hypothetical protein